MRTFTEFFGFYQDPFKRTPDVDFYYPTQMHIDALDTLLYLIHSDEPFAVLTGEPGTGKTITIKKFINELPANIVSAYILFPNLTPEELFMAILEDFNIQVDKSLTKNALFARLRDFLIDIGSQGKKAVIIIDEAQNLPNETLEELRLLSNLETEKNKLLKIILAGQPELDEKLNEDSLRQLKQRVTLYVKLDNIKQEDIKDYIYSHLEKAGKSYIKIQSGVIKRIAKITKGNPRLINTLMERSIIAAFLDNSHTITEAHLISALSSINNVISTVYRNKSIKTKPFLITAVIAVLALLVGFLGADRIFFNKSNNNSSIQVAQNTYNTPPATTNVTQPQTIKETLPNIEKEAVRTEPIQNNINDNQNYNNSYDNSDNIANTTTNIVSNNNRQNIETAGNIIEQPANNSNISQIETYTPQDRFIENNIMQIEEQPTTRNNANTNNYINNDVAKKDVYILANSLNVRSIPDLEAVRVGAVRMGEKYEYLSENNTWVEIRLSPTLTGWVFKQYVSISERP